MTALTLGDGPEVAVAFGGKVHWNDSIHFMGDLRMACFHKEGDLLKQSGLFGVIC